MNFTISVTVPEIGSVPSDFHELITKSTLENLEKAIRAMLGTLEVAMEIIPELKDVLPAIPEFSMEGFGIFSGEDVGEEFQKELKELLTKYQKKTLVENMMEAMGANEDEDEDKSG